CALPIWHPARDANEKSGWVGGRITGSGLAFDNFVNRMRWIFFMSNPALGFELAHRLFDRRGFRPALGEVNNFDDAGLVAFDRAFGIQKPKQGDDSQRNEKKFPGAHCFPVMSSGVETSLAILKVGLCVALT